MPKSLKHFCSSQGDVVSVVAAFRIGGQPSQCPQAVVERYADRARHVIVASSRGPQPAWRVGHEFAATNTREHAQPFKRTGHIRSFETVETMLPLNQHLSGHPKPANEGHLKTGQRE